LPNSRAKLLHEHVQASTGCIVAAGPFRGMRLVPDVSWGGGDVAAKLLGHYEAELHPVIERLAIANFDQILNTGCAEGFYAIGMAIRCPTEHIIAFDTDANAQRVCSANCATNGVQERVSIGGGVDPDLLKQLTADVANRLLIVDCEGYEAVLIDSNASRAQTSNFTRRVPRLCRSFYYKHSNPPVGSDPLFGLVGEGARDQTKARC
jgi:hypothetical protein